MNIDVQALDFALTEALLSEVERRVTDPLSKRHDQINGITVRLGDVNGPKGGEDKYCRVTVEMSGQNDLYVEDVESDMYTAIYRAGERMIRTVARKVSRERDRSNRHSSRHTPDLTGEQAFN